MDYIRPYGYDVNCKKCLSVITFKDKDIHDEEFKAPTNRTVTISGCIKCPVCGNKIVVKCANTFLDKVTPRF